MTLPLTAVSVASSSGSWLTWVLSMGVVGLLLAPLVRRTKFLYALRRVPYPTALPLIGNAYQLNCNLEEFFKKLIQWSREFGDIYLVWVGPRPFVFLYRVEAVQPLLSSTIHTDKSLEYNYLKPWLGSGLITSSGDKWHRRRKLLTPTFHSELLKEYFNIAAREAAVLVKSMQAEVNKAEFDFIPYAKRAALDVICESSMGYRINAQENHRNEYVMAVQKMTYIMQMRFTNIWISFDPIFKRTSVGREYENALKIIHNFVDKVIANRKKEWLLKQKQKFNGTVAKAQALLDLLFEMSNNGTVLSDKDIRDEVNTFMFAGHDTLATSISWILYALGRNPEYQDKILNEYYESESNDEISLDMIHKLTYLDACIKETLRLYPVVPLIARQIYSPIKIMDHEIPVGTTVLINSYLLHRDPRHFPQPDAYKPERFLPGSPKIPIFAFIPFSAGSRNCIGWKFAMMNIKVTILTILKSYEIHSIDKEDQLRFTSELVLNNAAGIRLRIKPRHHLE